MHHVLPELTDEFAKNNFGFDDVEAMRAAIAKEIGQQKKQALPQLKENRVTGKLAERLEGDPTPAYMQTIFQELGQNFLMQLGNQGTNLDNWLAANGISQAQFMADLQHQASDIARESLALDALVREQGLEATDADVEEEFKKAGVPDWLLNSAVVTISDEPEQPAEAEEKPAEEAPKKKTTRKRTTKKAAEETPAAEGEAVAEEAAEEAPKKKTTRKRTTKKAAEEAPAAEEKAE